MTERYTRDPFELELPGLIGAFGQVAVRPFDASAVAATAMAGTRQRNRPLAGIRWMPSLSGRMAVLLLLAALLLAMLAASLAANRPHLTPQGGSRAIVTAGAWSPDGSKLAFFVGGMVDGGADDGPYRELYVVDADGGGLRMLHRDHPTWSTMYGMPGALDWAPDGRRIAFQVAEPGALAANDATGLMTADIAVIGLDGDPPTIVTRDGPRGPLVGWSPTGDRLLFNAYRSDDGSDAYTIGADGNDLQLLTPSHLGLAVAWSPDGSKVLLEERSNAIPDVDTTDESWVVGADGSHPTRVSPPGAIAFAWSPDGARLFLRKTAESGATSILSVASDGSDIRTVDTSAPGGDWAWAHDRSRFATEGSEGVVIGAASGSTTLLTTGPADRSPRWSPDDTLISFLGTRQAGTGVFVVPAGGGDPRLVAANATSLGWRPSADGHQRLAFIRDGTIGTVDVTDGSTRDLVPRTEISERAIEPTAGQGIQDRMIITATGPDRDVYHVPLSPRLAFSFENRTDQPWLVLIDEGWFYHPDCHATASGSIVLASYHNATAAPRPRPAMLVEDCIVPPHATVGFDLPHEALGPLTVEMVPQDSPGASNQAPTDKPYVVVFDFDAGPALPSDRPS